MFLLFFNDLYSINTVSFLIFYRIEDLFFFPFTYTDSDISDVWTYIYHMYICVSHVCTPDIFSRTHFVIQASTSFFANGLRSYY